MPMPEEYLENHANNRVGIGKQFKIIYSVCDIAGGSY